MRLIIREYLSTLKESGELDALLPDLLTSMGIIPQSEPKIGSRQHGVDISAEGIDPNDSVNKLFLLTAKAGNISRHNWNSGSPNDVQPSLDEIITVYIQQRLDQKHQNLPKKIVLCCTGIIEQNVLDNWKGYKKKNAGNDIEFEFWGVNELAVLIEENILDEFLFPETAQKELRKTLALLDDSDYDLSDYYSFLESIFADGKISEKKSSKGDKERSKAIRLVNLSLNIIFKWAADNNNLLPVYKCSERAVLVVFNWLREKALLSRAKSLEEFSKLLNTYNDVSCALLLKLKDHCRVRDSLFQSDQEGLDYPLVCFEVMGILAIVGLFQLNISEYNQEIGFRGNAIEIATDLRNLLVTNPGTKTPLYDGHGIDICLAAFLLHQVGFEEDLKKWVRDLINRIIFAYRVDSKYPVSTDSFEDLLEREFTSLADKKKLFNLSTLLPMLTFWLIILEDRKGYKEYQQAFESYLKETDFQLWTADMGSEDFIYTEKISNQTGSTFSSITFYKQFREGENLLLRLKDSCIQPNDFKSIDVGLPIMIMMACRHFRNPIPPFLWLHLYKDYRCKALTNSGNRCSREAVDGDYCWQHSKN